jgi:hypothetical protein
VTGPMRTGSNKTSKRGLRAMADPLIAGLFGCAESN